MPSSSSRRYHRYHHWFGTSAPFVHRRSRHRPPPLLAITSARTPTWRLSRSFTWYPARPPARPPARMQESTAAVETKMLREQVALAEEQFQTERTAVAQQQLARGGVGLPASTVRREVRDVCVRIAQNACLSLRATPQMHPSDTLTRRQPQHSTSLYLVEHQAVTEKRLLEEQARLSEQQLMKERAAFAEKQLKQQSAAAAVSGASEQGARGRARAGHRARGCARVRAREYVWFVRGHGTGTYVR